MSPRSIQARIRRGSWTKLGMVLVIHDVHTPGDVATGWIMHLHAGAHAQLSGPLAARLQGWHIVGDDHIVVSRTAVRPPPGLQWHIVRRSSDPAVRRTSPRAANSTDIPPMCDRLDALVDTLIARPDPQARSLLDHALQQRWIDVAAIDTVISQRSGPGRRGQPKLRRLRERAASGSRSEAEHRMAALLREAGGYWRANYPIHDQAGRLLAEIDFADAENLIAIEVDGRAFHSDREAFERDRVRQNLLTLRGWVVLRFTWERLINDPAGVIAEVRAAQRARWVS